ncbi:MAG TPA: 2-oxo acid dehydrogenase subunit E2 [Solirubrobacteraceae bacterium]|nr:2-oxo acid dehydrogenase subunit E2 [Solirubrobacteraceae bacterium]
MSDAAAAESLGPGIKGEVTVIELDRQARAVARRSAETRATVPTMEFTNLVNMDAALAREAELGCGTVPLLISAVARALQSVRRVNGSYRDGRYELYSRINIGVTMVDEGIYVTPTIFDADQKSELEVATDLADFYVRAREGELLPNELTGATFTVVDSSAYDIVALSPMIIAPQAGALAAGPVRDVPVVRRGEVVPGHTMQLALSVDHRIVYGHHAAQFLEEVKAQFEGAGA